MGEHWQGEGRHGPRRGAVRQGAQTSLPSPILPQVRTVSPRTLDLNYLVIY